MKDKLNRFVENTIGNFQEVSYKDALYQCMDLAYEWVFCLGYPKATIQHQYAYQVFTEPNDLTRQYFDIIPNSPEGIPQDGDLVIYNKTSSNIAGHIVIALGGGTTSKYMAYEQNSPIGTNAHISEKTYGNCLGWLRPKIEMGMDVSTDKKVLLELITQGFEALKDDDIYKNGNLEGYVRGLIGEHPLFAEFESKSKQFDGFVAKWISEWQIKNGSTIADVEHEMSNYLHLVDEVERLRNSIEKVVGTEFTDENSMLKSLEAIGDDKKRLQAELTEALLKLSNKKILKMYNIGKYVVKICRR
jgi:hypothetical protein